MPEIYTAAHPMPCFACGSRIEKGQEYTYTRMHEGRQSGLVAVCLPCAGAK